MTHRILSQEELEMLLSNEDSEPSETQHYRAVADEEYSELKDASSKIQRLESIVQELMERIEQLEQSKFEMMEALQSAAAASEAALAAQPEPENTIAEPINVSRSVRHKVKKKSLFG